MTGVQTCALPISFMAMVDEGTPFTVYGIPVSVQNYASTILPILLSVWVMSYIEKFFKKYTPDAIKVLAVPFLTIAIMLPISLCALGPLGSFMGTYICAGILWFGENFGFVGAAIIGGLWEFLVMSGMHHVMIAQMIQMVAANGYDPVVTLGAASASMSVAGMCLGMALALRDKEEKSLGFSYLVAAIIEIGRAHV